MLAYRIPTDAPKEPVPGIQGAHHPIYGTGYDATRRGGQTRWFPNRWQALAFVSGWTPPAAKAETPE